jgi:23S rRNA pseudouridine1911/1915/1917 synthase
VADTVDLEVPDSLDGERVDKVVADVFELSRARATTLVERGVRVDGEPARASTRVRSGQVINCEQPQDVAVLEPEEVAFEVLHEDPAVIVVDKPAGVVVHPGSGRSRGTLAAGLIYRFPELVGVGVSDRWGLIHRLDKDTSGAMVVGRTPDSFDDLVAQLRRRDIERTYTALVEGLMSSPTGTIEAPIGRDPSRPTRRTVTHGGKFARTHYEVVELFEESSATLFEVKLETGRTHQIRVHMAAIDHPVAGDRTYGATRKDLGSPRTFLHAARVALTHPDSGERLEVSAPLPDDLAAVLAGLS